MNSLKSANIVDKIKDKNKSFLFVNINLSGSIKKKITYHSKPNLKCSESPRLGIQICLHAITVISKETAFYDIRIESTKAYNYQIAQR